MNDELTPAERAALRARIVGGAHDIKPVGAHRGAWIAGSVATALVVAIAGGVAVTSTLSAPPVATTPSPSATATAEPTPTLAPTRTPTSSPTSTPTAPAVAFGGDCSAVLNDAAASALVGADVRLAPGLPVWDSDVLGGISCQWRAEAPEDWRALNITVLPWSVVPEQVRARVDGVPACEGGGPCDYSQRFGNTWVVADADDSAVAVRAVAEVGSRPAASAVRERPLRADAWRLEDCREQIGDAVGTTLGRDDLGPLGTDSVPQGQVWDVLEARGAAAWCSFAPTSYDESLPPFLRISIGAGEVSDAGEIERLGGVPVTVTGARTAWWLAHADGTGGSVRADASGGVLEVDVTNLSEERAREVAAAIIAALG
ncbi:hypothetical protein [Microbacterium sp. VKM Ac-2923]|uniref:hypothetical protein n=1 Tax=Microbacterium sp. VKM Ac-2923 TaxID=2929476 RepID=UPI001FB2EE1A|nr:hypothetical protein [Microbacterium sp. VKM Ac-2923]MCJ1708173.1 hypothetical protein [Microbacterium sp. VKM Ac-2923]